MSDIESVLAERDALGIQLAAARERLALALGVVSAARKIDSAWRCLFSSGYPELQTALARFDEVPGDQLHDTEAKP